MQAGWQGFSRKVYFCVAFVPNEITQTFLIYFPMFDISNIIFGTKRLDIVKMSDRTILVPSVSKDIKDI